MISTRAITTICFTLLCITTNYITTAKNLMDTEGTTIEPSTTPQPDLCRISDDDDSLSSSTIVCEGVRGKFQDSAWYDSQLPMICLHCDLGDFTFNTFSYSNKFTALDLSSSNVLSVNDSALEQFTSCEIIDLSNNVIKSISDKAFPSYMKHLTELYLQSNLISSLSAVTFTSLVSLETLNLANNQLTSSTFKRDFFLNMTALKVLDLGHNKIEALEYFTFSHLIDLQELNLEGNQLTTLVLGAFKELSSLTNLNLADNKLTKLPLGTFSGLTQLRELKLSNNKLQDFNGTELLSSFIIDDVDISNNNISSLNEHLIYDNAPTLTTIHLEGNFFYCDNLVEMLEFFKGKGVQYPVENGEYASSNIGGIRCVVKNSTRSDATSFNYKQNLIRSLFAAFSAVVLFIW